MLQSVGSLFIPNFATMKKIVILLFSCLALTFNVRPQETFNQLDGNGSKQGPWKLYHAGDSVVKVEGKFKDDKPVGTFLHYYSNGDLRVKHVFDNGEISRVVNYWPDGTVMGAGKYIGEAKDSTWLYYDQWGSKVAEEYYIEGKKYGNWKVYYPTGILMEERFFERDMENGLFRQYFENGKIYREATYVDGGQEGLVTFYHENGQVESSGNYLKDVKHGLWKYYDENGELLRERTYIKGVPTDRDSEIINEDTTNYYRKDRFTIDDVMGEDVQKVPTKEEEREMKKKK